jgi:tetratricopeptide (TPR) repeat protein
MRTRALIFSLLLAGCSVALRLQMLSAEAQVPKTGTEERAARHSGTEWGMIAPHLPNPATATAAQLETAGDVLKARRFPEDAIEYYQYAIAHGGNQAQLFKKMGVARLELRQNALARALFVQCVHASKKDAQAWNNLGATDYSMGAYGASIGEYKRAVRLDKTSAVFHANLGMSYFENHEMDRARTQFAMAMQLDPTIMEDRSSGGTTLRILQSQDYGRLCFEMAKTYMKKGEVDESKHWMQKASEHGLNLRMALNDDADLREWLKDPQVQVMIENADRLHRRAAVTSAPTLGAASDAAVPN